MTAVSGAWVAYIEAFNTTIGGLAEPISAFGRVANLLAKEDLSEPMALDGGPIRSDVWRLIKTTNNMIEMFNGFASEVMSVCLEIDQVRNVLQV
jgi:hypothetical protein